MKERRKKKKRRLRRGPRARREAIWGLAFILPSLVGTTIFTLMPSWETLRRSFTNAMGDFIGFANFETVLNNKAFQMAASNTGRFMITCVPMLIVLSLLLALLLNKVGSSALRASFLLPMAVPVASVALLWNLVFNNHGALNGIFERLGAETTDWMNSASSFWVLVGSYIWRNVGYDMVLFLAALSNISPSLYEAADIDGANAFRKFRSITLPQLAPSLFVVTILSLLNAFKVYREVYLLAGDYPFDHIYMLQHTFNNWFRGLEMDKLSAGAVLTALVICLLIVLLQRAWGNQGEVE